jgi:hypothetical protein
MGSGEVISSSPLPIPHSPLPIFSMFQGIVTRHERLLRKISGSAMNRTYKTHKTYKFHY